MAKFFNRDLREKILLFSSSEWAWIDNKPENVINNGQLSHDWLAYSYVLNELVKDYTQKRGGIDNYEDFYQYVIDISNNIQDIELIFEKAKSDLLKDKPYLDKNDPTYYKGAHFYLLSIDKKQYHKLPDIINYLIADILNVFVSDYNLINKYSSFIKYIMSFDEVDIFTLNHDILLERLLSLCGLEFSKGFTNKESPIQSNGKKLEYYNGNFDKKIRIYKLHGSLDLYRFNHYNQNLNSYTPLDTYDYFLTRDYREKHNTVRVNPKDGQIIQDYNFDIVPKFITGTNKTSIIQNDIMYKQLFDTYVTVISETENLFVSGYSFFDNHINESLKKNTKLNFINHRRSKDYPFSTNGKNISSFDELL